jgi:hypothetical protein
MNIQFWSDKPGCKPLLIPLAERIDKQQAEQIAFELAGELCASKEYYDGRVNGTTVYIHEQMIYDETGGLEDHIPEFHFQVV